MSVCEFFSRALPEYLAIGMPYELFWDGDVWLARSFRLAHKRKRELANYDAYLLGTYVYDALVRVAPAFNAFSKSHKPVEWIDGPYEMRSAEKGEEHEVSDDQSSGLAFMLNYMSAHNKAMADKAN